MIMPREPEVFPAGGPGAGAEAEIDLGTLWRGVRQRLPVLLLTALALALVVYLGSRVQPPVYQASASLLVSSSQSQIGVVGGSVVSPLPQDTVAQVVQGPLVLQPLIRAVRESRAIAPAERERLVVRLTRDLQNVGAGIRGRTPTVTVRGEAGENGVYTLRARARTPGAAHVLANLASAQLLAWDVERTLRDVRLAEQNFRLQLGQVDRRLTLPGLTSQERLTLTYRRATLQDNLAQLAFLESARTGVLRPLASAVRPLRPIAPAPLRNALLAGLLTLLLGVGVVLLEVILRRTVRSEDDLLALRLPTLATLPRLRRTAPQPGGELSSARGQRMAGALGFLRVEVQAALQTRTHPVLLLAGTARGEGASTVTALLAADLAASGQQVLLIDADLRHGTQQGLWGQGAGDQAWRQLCGVGGARSFHDALLDPENVQVLEAGRNVHLLPAGPDPHGSLPVSRPSDLRRALDLWRQKYDLVLLDSAPLLTHADGLVLGAHADAVLLVTEAGRTNIQAVRSAIRRAERSGLKLLGFVINKSGAREESVPGSSPSPAPRQEGMRQEGLKV